MSSLPYTGNQATYQDNVATQKLLVPVIREIYALHTIHDDPRERQRLVLQKTLIKAFAVTTLDRTMWQYKAVAKLFKREEKTDFGRRKTAFDGKITRDTSQGRTTRTDFTANCEMREASAVVKATGVAINPDHAQSVGIGQGGTMAQRLAAKRKSMMSWEDFKEKNLGDLPGGTEKAMIEYRMMLDRERDEKLGR